MCGIIGVVGRSAVNQTLYDGLTVLQHRGQDAAGIITCDEGQLHLRKSNGLVRDAFHTRHVTSLMCVILWVIRSGIVLYRVIAALP